MPRKVTRSTATPVKREGKATTSSAAVEGVTRPPFGAASLTDLAQQGFPSPHRFALLFPRLTPGEQAALTESIRVNNGVREPITIFNGQIADGISRCLSAIELGHRWEQVRKTKFEGD
jgi:hypothetical protein